MTVPTVGRVMLFRPSTRTGDSCFMNPVNGEPCAAIVAAVGPDNMVNLSVFDAEGNQHARQNVPVIQDGETEPGDGYFAYWMPFQIKQHAKNEEVKNGCMSGSPFEVTDEQRLSGLRYTALQYATQQAHVKTTEEVIAAAEIYFNWLK